MSTAHELKLCCPECGYVPADLSQTTASYGTNLDVRTQARTIHLISTIYLLRCPKCHHEFSDKVRNKETVGR
jgi:uncharacterized C2H2 Zn-finger protein